MQNLLSTFKGKKVLVTGHTGFKGAWLVTWLLDLGAIVTGVSLPGEGENRLFDALGIEDSISNLNVDIRNSESLKDILTECEPDFIFHLAAQSLVRQSYISPQETFSTNLMGTVNLLDAIKSLELSYRKSKKVCAVVIVTTDKCYENREWVHGYRENDPLGGYDTYSASKACAEIATSSYRKSFFSPENVQPIIGVSTARAGNVIGGGDWAKDRIIPDAVRSLLAGQTVKVRNPCATRPWQHVLEPLSGYLILASTIHTALRLEDEALTSKFCSAYNFGPDIESNKNVKDLVELCLAHWGGEWRDISNSSSPHEATLLSLVWDKAYLELGWRPRWPFEVTVEKTISWYKKHSTSPSSARSLVIRDIHAYWSELGNV